MDLNRLYRYLKEGPRDGRWMLRRVGPDFPVRLEELKGSGRPVEMRLEEVEGLRRAVYRAADQPELFDPEELRPSRQRRHRRTASSVRRRS